jgi:aspartokinase
MLKNCDFVKNVRQVVLRRSLSRISVIGSSVTFEIGRNLVEVLKSQKIDTFGFSVNRYRIDIIVAGNRLAEAVIMLHKYCGLEK